MFKFLVKPFMKAVEKIELDAARKIKENIAEADEIIKKRVLEVKKKEKGVELATKVVNEQYQEFKKSTKMMFNFKSFTTEEIMLIIANGELIRKIAQVALTKTTHDNVTTDEQKKAIRSMEDTIEDIVEGFKHIKREKQVDDERRKLLGTEKYKGNK